MLIMYWKGASVYVKTDYLDPKNLFMFDMYNEGSAAQIQKL